MRRNNKDYQQFFNIIYQNFTKKNGIEKADSRQLYANNRPKIGYFMQFLKQFIKIL